MLERSEDKRYAVKFACLDSLVPEGHLLRKIEKAIDFEAIYPMVEHLYCKDNGRPAADPVVLVKMALLQHLYGIPSLRRTRDEVEMNIAYRWFIGYDIDTPVPHFATISYAFATRFPGEVFEQIFSWILEEAVGKGLVKPQVIFIDATHVKANANKKKRRKELAQKTARIYDEQLRAEIEADRAAHGKKPLKAREEDDDTDGGSIETDVFYGKWRIQETILPEWLDVPFNSNEPGFRALDCIGFELEYGDGYYRVNDVEFTDVRFESDVSDHFINWGQFTVLFNHVLNELDVSERYKPMWDTYRYCEYTSVRSDALDALEDEEKVLKVGVNFKVIDENRLLLRPVICNLLAVRIEDEE